MSHTRFTDTTPPERGTMKKIVDDVFWLRFDLPFRLNHINLYILDNGDSWTIIDCGVYSNATAAHWRELLAGPLEAKPVREIIVTHHHPDHIGYAGVLAYLTSAPVTMSKPEYEHAEKMFKAAGPEYGEVLANAYREYGLEDEMVELGRKDSDRYVKNIALPPAAPQFLKTGDTVKSSFGEWKIRTDCGHSIDQIGMTDAERGIYIAGDYLLPRISPNVSTNPANYGQDRLGAYLEYLNEMTALPPDMLILPGHDWPFYEGGTRAKKLIAHHEARLASLTSAALRKPLTVSGALDILFEDRDFGAHELFFATGEAHAHLIHLVETGVMKKEHENGVMKFSPAS